MADQPVRPGHVIVVLLWAAGLLAVANQYHMTLAGDTPKPPAHDTASPVPEAEHPAPH